MPVSNATATAISNTELQLAWQDNADDEEYFEIWMGSDPQNTTIRLGTVRKDQTSEPINALVPDTRYCFEIRAVNSAGYQPVSLLTKPCARTLPDRIDFGQVQIANVPGVDNTLCAGIVPDVRLHAFFDRDGDGLINALPSGGLNKPGPAGMVPDVNHTPAWRIFSTNRYAPGANMVLIGDMFPCGGHDPQFVALHMFWDGGENVTPVLFMAGNYRERTGPSNELFGTVMTQEELSARLRFDRESGSVVGQINRPVEFFVEIPNTGVSFHSAAQVAIDFTSGVKVQHE